MNTVTDLEIPEQPRADDAPPRRRRRWRRSAGRLASYLIMVFVLVTLNFFIPRAMPGDPIEGLLSQGATGFSLGEQARAKFAEYYGLDGSLVTQYKDYLLRLAHGDLGRSIVTNRPVTYEIGRHLPWTVLLIGSSMLVATAVGLVLGVNTGWRRDRPLDRVVMTVLLAVREFPAYLVGSMLLFVFAVHLGWLPLAGAYEPFSQHWPLGDRIVDVARHLVLPMLVLASGLAVGNYLIMRASMVSELGADYLVLGRAKGLPARHLKYRYAARNALLPVVSLTAMQMGFVLTGDVLIERVFAYPGLGSLLAGAITARDYPVIQGTFLLISVSVVTVNALADLLYRRLDPRTAE